MACPLCGERCTCSYVPPRAAREQARVSALIDPEEHDLSEQEFEASLAGSAVHEAVAVREDQAEAVWKLVSAVAPPQPQDTSLVEETPHWREEVTSRVEKYRARRKRPPRERSLSLDFERAVNRAVTESSVASRQSPVASESSVVSLQSSGDGSACREQAPEPLIADSAPDTAISGPIPEDYPTEDRRLTTDDSPSGDWQAATGDCNVIEFPRLPLVIMPPSAEELAEPVIDKPRILEAPEAVQTAQAPLAAIRLGPEEEESPAVEFELPLAVADMSRRAFAGLVDVLIVVLASALFLMIVVRGEATLPPGKTGAMLLVAAPILFWAVYEYLFLVYAGTTPGMQIAGLALVSFEGEAVRRRTRRGRALAMVLSCLSLGLGLLWALLDEDTLCWHDRISRTYVVGNR